MWIFYLGVVLHDTILSALDIVEVLINYYICGGVGVLDSLH